MTTPTTFSKMEGANPTLVAPPIKKSNTISAADVIAGNEDLSTEILLLLPVQSLVRFKCVSKDWCRFLSTPQFTRAHTNNLIHKHPDSLLSRSGIYFYYSCSDETPKIDAVFLSKNSVPPVSSMEKVATMIGSRFKVLQSCNGLLLCSFTKNCSRLAGLIVVFNPATLYVNDVPSLCDDRRQMELVLGYHLVYDPAVSHDYKVICVKKVRAVWMPRLEIFIYMSDNNSWRKSSTFEDPGSMRFGSGLFWSGGIHWIGHHDSLHFDVASEIMTRRNMPPRPRGSGVKKTRYFGEWYGHLHFIQIKSVSSIKFNVLELNKDTSKWFVKYRVHLAHIIAAFPEVVMEPEIRHKTWYNFNILAVVRGEKEEDSELILAIPGKVISYNFISKTAKLLHDMPEKASEELNIDCCCSYPYSETLTIVGKHRLGQQALDQLFN